MFIRIISGYTEGASFVMYLFTTMMKFSLFFDNATVNPVTLLITWP